MTAMIILATPASATSISSPDAGSDRSQPLRLDGVAHQRLNAVSVEGHDKEQIDSAEDIVNGADRRDDNARCIALFQLQHRQPEVQMLVVPPGNDFIVRNEEDRPRPDFFTDAVLASDLRAHDFADGRSFQTEHFRNRIADNQQALHPERRMSEHGKEDLDAALLRTRHRRAIAVVKICISDCVPAQRAAGWQIAFDYLPAELQGARSRPKHPRPSRAPRALAPRT